MSCDQGSPKHKEGKVIATTLNRIKANYRNVRLRSHWTN